MTADAARKLAALAEAARQFAIVRIGSAERFAAKPRLGHLRGIDFYSRRDLVRAMGRAFYGFKKKHRVYPNIVNPVGFNEKIVWLKFFAEIPVPEAGNKSLTHCFIPANRTDVKAVPIVARLTDPVLPPNDAVESGWYFVKANHGSDMLRHVHFPLSDDDRRGLQTICAKWLTWSYGWANGEWWYSAFPREILIERAITADEPAVTWSFTVLDGAVGRVNILRKVAGETFETRFEADFTVSPEQNSERRPVLNYDDFGERNQMAEIALAIAKPFGLSRVDMYVTADREIYLGEMTFAPSNGHLILSEERDLALGRMVRSIP